VWNARCWVRAIVGKLDDALDDCDESLALRPRVANTLDSRGLVYLKLGKFDRSIEDYDAALKLDPQKAYSLYGRGTAKLKKGDTAAGEADIAKAKEIRTDIAEQFAKLNVK